MFEECFQLFDESTPRSIQTALTGKSVQSGTSKVSVTVTVNICMMETVVSEGLNNKLNKLTKT